MIAGFNIHENQSFKQEYKKKEKIGQRILNINQHELINDNY